MTRAGVVIDPNVEPLYSTDKHHDSCALSSTLQAKKKKIEVTVKKYTVELCLLCIPWGDWEGIVFLLSSVFTSLIKTVNYLLEECLTLENSSILMPGVMLTFLSQ